MGLLDGVIGLVKDTVSDKDKLGNTVSDVYDIFGNKKPTQTVSTPPYVPYGAPVENKSSIPGWAGVALIGFFAFLLFK